MILNVRQISNYPASGVLPSDTLLMQRGGLGGPYVSTDAATLVATALADAGPIGIGFVPPSGSYGAQVFTENLILQGALLFNAAFGTDDLIYGWTNGPVGVFDLIPGIGTFQWQVAQGQAGQPLPPLTQVMQLTHVGNLSLPLGTLTVARDPIQPMDVATLNWVSNNTVASFNNRIGRVQLTQADVYGALQLDSAIATQTWSIGAINAAIGDFVSTYPLVTCWNGRTGNVYLTLSDITCTFYQPGQQPISPTPPITSNDDSIATTKWVAEYIANEFAGGGGNLATQAWVLANTVNSFNGRQGQVTLTLADITNVGGAPINSPNFSGFPTAPTMPVGNVGGSIATTAYVWSVIQEVSTGVTTWNGRSGNVTMTSADVAAAGGLANPSANLTGQPTAPTAAPGTTTPQLANCDFVMTAIGNAVTSFNTRTGAVTLLLADITGVGGAPLANPTFTGVPAAPTANAGTNTTQIATTAFVTAALATAGGVASFNGRTGEVELEANDLSAVGALFNPSPQLTGTPIAPTAAPGTNTNQIATTAFVITTIGSNAVASFNGRTGTVTLTTGDITGAGGAPIANPTFTGTPAAPTAAAGTNNTQIATTAFVTEAIAADTTGVTSFNTRTGAVTLVTSDITGAGGAPSASPTFTGVPLAPTATPGTANTQIATTAFVAAAIAASGVTSFNGRTGAVTLLANDISAASGALIASPTFTGTPAAPTASPGTNTTQLATCAFVTAAIGAYLPLTGGTLTGVLNTTQVYFSTNQSVTDFWIGRSAPTRLINWGSGWFDGWNESTGIRVWQSSAGQLAQLDASGNFQTAGELVASTSVQSNGGRIISTSSANPSVACFFPPGYAAGMWATGTGTLTFGTTSGAGVPSTGYGFFTAGGNLTINGTLTQGSDANNKTNISLVTQGISLIRQLIPKSFAWNSTPNVPQWGFIAQDVEAVIPEAVSSHETAPGESSLGLDTTAILAAAIYAIKQLDQRCQALEAAASITPPAGALA